MEQEDFEKLKKVGKIASEVIKFARDFIKPGMLLVEIAEKIEDKIVELGAKPAFPATLSIDEVAAHSTPSFNSEEKAHGLLKVDIGCHIDGFIADTAVSLNLAEDPKDRKENDELIKAAESALEKGQEKAEIGLEVREVGREIEEDLKSKGVQPIVNLSGHSIEPWELHSGVTVPNVDNFKSLSFEEGVYAIEPFTTKGLGLVKDGKLSEIYHLESEGNVRDSFAREVLGFISEEYKTLPFCSRWIYGKFGSRGLLALRQIDKAGLLHNYPQLIEKSGSKVAQAENTIILTSKEKIISTLN